MKYFTGFTFDGTKFAIEIRNKDVKHFKNAMLVQALHIGYKGFREELPSFIKDGEELLRKYLDQHNVNYKLIILQKKKIN